jgi:phage-related protein
MAPRQPEPKTIRYFGSTAEVIREFPLAVREDVAAALDVAALGGKHYLASPMAEFRGAKVFAIKASFSTDTYRVVYTVEFRDALWVVLAFQKKSTRGIATPRRFLNTVTRRLQSLRGRRGA